MSKIKLIELFDTLDIAEFKQVIEELNYFELLSIADYQKATFNEVIEKLTNINQYIIKLERTGKTDKLDALKACYIAIKQKLNNEHDKDKEEALKKTIFEVNVGKYWENVITKEWLTEADLGRAIENWFKKQPINKQLGINTTNYGSEQLKKGYRRSSLAIKVLAKKYPKIEPLSDMIGKLLNSAKEKIPDGLFQSESTQSTKDNSTSSASSRSNSNNSYYSSWQYSGSASSGSNSNNSYSSYGGSYKQEELLRLKEFCELVKKNYASYKIAWVKDDDGQVIFYFPENSGSFYVNKFREDIAKLGFKLSDEDKRFSYETNGFEYQHYNNKRLNVLKLKLSKDEEAIFGDIITIDQYYVDYLLKNSGIYKSENNRSYIFTRIQSTNHQIKNIFQKLNNGQDPTYQKLRTDDNYSSFSAIINDSSVIAKLDKMFNSVNIAILTESENKEKLYKILRFYYLNGNSSKQESYNNHYLELSITDDQQPTIKFLKNIFEITLNNQNAIYFIRKSDKILNNLLFARLTDEVRQIKDQFESITGIKSISIDNLVIYQLIAIFAQLDQAQNSFSFYLDPLLAPEVKRIFTEYKLGDVTINLSAAANIKFNQEAAEKIRKDRKFFELIIEGNFEQIAQYQSNKIINYINVLEALVKEKKVKVVELADEKIYLCTSLGGNQALLEMDKKYISDQRFFSLLPEATVNIEVLGDEIKKLLKERNLVRPIAEYQQKYATDYIKNYFTSSKGTSIRLNNQNQYVFPYRSKNVAFELTNVFKIIDKNFNYDDSSKEDIIIKSAPILSFIKDVLAGEELINEDFYRDQLFNYLESIHTSSKIQIGEIYILFSGFPGNIPDNIIEIIMNKLVYNYEKPQIKPNQIVLFEDEKRRFCERIANKKLESLLLQNPPQYPIPGSEFVEELQNSLPHIQLFNSAQKNFITLKSGSYYGGKFRPYLHDKVRKLRSKFEEITGLTGLKDCLVYDLISLFNNVGKNKEKDQFELTYIRNIFIDSKSIKGYISDLQRSTEIFLNINVSEDDNRQVEAIYNFKDKVYQKRITDNYQFFKLAMENNIEEAMNHMVIEPKLTLDDLPTSIKSALYSAVNGINLTDENPIFVLESSLISVLQNYSAIFKIDRNINDNNKISVTIVDKDILDNIKFYHLAVIAATLSLKNKRLPEEQRGKEQKIAKISDKSEIDDFLENIFTQIGSKSLTPTIVNGRLFIFRLSDFGLNIDNISYKLKIELEAEKIEISGNELTIPLKSYNKYCEQYIEQVVSMERG